MIRDISDREKKIVRKVEDSLFFLGEVMRDKRSDGIIRNMSGRRSLAKKLFMRYMGGLLEFVGTSEASDLLQGMTEYFLKEYYRVTTGGIAA